MQIKEAQKMKCTEINKLPEEQIAEIIDVVIDYYHAQGFPYYKIDAEQATADLYKLIDFPIEKLILEGNTLQQNMLGLRTVNAYHPQMWDIACNRQKTPMQIFMSRDLFRVALRKRIKYSDTKLVDFNIRKSLKAFGGQSVSNFRPTIAKFIYETYAPPMGTVLDPCMGYGGRLFGAASAHAGTLKYFGVDPDGLAVAGNKALAEDIGYYPGCQLFQAPFEDIGVADNRFELIFTSPPYFDKERYNPDCKEQSWRRYPSYNEWLEGFMHPLISKSYKALRPGGAFVLNVGEPIIKDTVEIANERFGAPEKTWHMRLSKMVGTSREESHKVEPIYVWRKEHE